jgi:hypothetical protein
MIDETNTQPDAEVAETPTDDLDQILSEFDTSVTPEPAAAEPSKARMDMVEEFIQQQQAKETRVAIQDSVEKFKGFDSALSNVGSTAVEGYINLMAQRDTRIADAFHKREENPDAWGRVLKSMAGEFSKEFKGPDAQITEDRNAMRAAVESQPDTVEQDGPTVRDLNKMSDAEFHRYKESLS